MWRWTLLLISLVAFSACWRTERVPQAESSERKTAETSDSASMTFQKTCEGKEVDLRNPNHPPAVAGDEGYGYHQVGNHDLDGDEVTETVHVIAKAIKDGSEYSRDDGSPWHVYVEEPTGERTYLYSDFVQLGI